MVKKFVINSKQVKLNCLAAVKAILGGDDMEVIIQPHVDDQTHEQRQFFHVLVGILAKDLGYNPNEMKQAIKCDYYGSEMKMILGKEREIVQSTTKNNKDEYSLLIEHTYKLAAEQGCVLPNPQYKGR